MYSKKSWLFIRPFKKCSVSIGIVVFVVVINIIIIEIPWKPTIWWWSHRSAYAKTIRVHGLVVVYVGPGFTAIVQRMAIWP